MVKDSLFVSSLHVIWILGAKNIMRGQQWLRKLTFFMEKIFKDQSLILFPNLGIENPSIGKYVCALISFTLVVSKFNVNLKIQKENIVC